MEISYLVVEQNYTKGKEKPPTSLMVEDTRSNYMKRLIIVLKDFNEAAKNGSEASETIYPVGTLWGPGTALKRTTPNPEKKWIGKI